MIIGLSVREYHYIENSRIPTLLDHKVSSKALAAKFSDLTTDKRLYITYS